MCVIFRDEMSYLLLCAKRKISDQNEILKISFQTTNFVAFAQTIKTVISPRNLAQIQKTCVCSSPFFSRFFFQMFYYLFRFFIWLGACELGSQDAPPKEWMLFSMECSTYDYLGKCSTRSNPTNQATNIGKFSKNSNYLEIL